MEMGEMMNELRLLMLVVERWISALMGCSRMKKGQCRKKEGKKKGSEESKDWLDRAKTLRGNLLQPMYVEG